MRWKEFFVSYTTKRPDKQQFIELSLMRRSVLDRQFNRLRKRSFAVANAVSVDFGKAERRRSYYPAGNLITQFIELLEKSTV